MKTFKRFWKMWALAGVLSLPCSAILIYGRWSMVSDPLSVPVWIWLYLINAGFAAAYFQLRYWEPK